MLDGPAASDKSEQRVWVIRSTGVDMDGKEVFGAFEVPLSDALDLPLAEIHESREGALSSLVGVSLTLEESRLVRSSRRDGVVWFAGSSQGFWSGDFTKPTSMASRLSVMLEKGLRIKSIYEASFWKAPPTSKLAVDRDGFFYLRTPQELEKLQEERAAAQAKREKRRKAAKKGREKKTRERVEAGPPAWTVNDLLCEVVRIKLPTTHRFLLGYVHLGTWERIRREFPRWLEVFQPYCTAKQKKDFCRFLQEHPKMQGLQPANSDNNSNSSSNTGA